MIGVKAGTADQDVCITHLCNLYLINTMEKAVRPAFIVLCASDRGRAIEMALLLPCTREKVYPSPGEAILHN